MLCSGNGANINPCIDERKFIVFESHLLSLFKSCPQCQHPTTISLHTIGSYVHINRTCARDSCAYRDNWDSQPYVQDTPAGNLLLSAAILFSGSLPSKAIRMLQFINCACITDSTFYTHQRRYLQPAITNIWKREQANMVTLLQVLDKPLLLGGDGRCDSPGYSAKYGSYTLMELKHNAILNVELIQVQILNFNYCITLFLE